MSTCKLTRLSDVVAVWEMPKDARRFSLHVSSAGMRSRKLKRGHQLVLSQALVGETQDLLQVN